MVIRKFDIFLVKLDPTVGSEIKKTRPCVVVSPDEMNRRINTVLLAPLTSSKHTYSWRAVCSVQGKLGQIALDQMRAVDKQRLLKPLGRLSVFTQRLVTAQLMELFQETNSP